MPAALKLNNQSLADIDAFAAALGAAGNTAWASTVRQARTFQGRVERASGWEQVDLGTQLEWMRKARPFVSWLLITGRLTATAGFLAFADLRLGGTARKHLPHAHAWFVTATKRLDASAADTALQWNVLCKIAVLSGTRPDDVDTERFLLARVAIYDAYTRRGRPEADRNVRAIFHRLQLTLFHDNKIDSLARAVIKTHVSVSGWETITALYKTNAKRYIEQVTLSLRPSTIKHVELHLRAFGNWLADRHPEIASCADLERHHIEAFKKWLSVHPRPRTGKPLALTSIEEQLINLGCFFDRTTEWGYPNTPTRPLIFVGDLPRIDRAPTQVPRRRRRSQTRSSHPQRTRSRDSDLCRNPRAHQHPTQRTTRPHRRRSRANRLSFLASHTHRQTPQRPLHPTAP